MKNTTGVRALDKRVLVKVEETELEAKMRTMNLHVPDSVKEKETGAAVVGVIVDIGASAFPEWEDAPKAGDRILFKRYAGLLHKGSDGIEYRVMNDEDIAAILD